MKQTIKCLIAVFAAMFLGVAAFAQVTTSSLNGYVADETGDPLVGAAIVAVHTPSGTQYATIANESGRFNINGMRAGGPYKIEVSFLGMATIYAEATAAQLVRRVAFRRAMKQAVGRALKSGAEGVKIALSGRLAGADIARTEWYSEGKVPLHTLRADIDYGFAEADTTYGKIGVKVWIYKGEVLPGAKNAQTKEGGN